MGKDDILSDFFIFCDLNSVSLRAFWKTFGGIESGTDCCMWT